ncbi:MAG: peptidylprolyl isomerase [Porticoccus sp.]|nr:peptidylprolyl isomerase [Porticoccus sp.]MDX2349111.1 peptidylprolyl isomerase [Porticoccus sp.]
MKIEKNSVVTFHYQMQDELGEVLEGTKDGDPTVFLHSNMQMIASLELSMVSKEPGDTYSITLPPELAYGILRDKSDIRVPSKHVLTEGKLEPGMVVSIQTNEGVRPVTLIKVGKFNVDIDTNHPLAGKTLTFDVEIVDVRKATSEELSHGHAHGAGGHEH